MQQIVSQREFSPPPVLSFQRASVEDACDIESFSKGSARPLGPWHSLAVIAHFSRLWRSRSDLPSLRPPRTNPTCRKPRPNDMGWHPERTFSIPFVHLSSRQLRRIGDPADIQLVNAAGPPFQGTRTCIRFHMVFSVFDSALAVGTRIVRERFTLSPPSVSSFSGG